MTSEGQNFRYRPDAVWPDVARGAAGFVVTAAPLPWLADSIIAFVLLAGLAIAFAIFTLTTAARLRTTVRLDDAGISTSGIRGVTVSWDRMQAVDLNYFSTRRDRERGWMQLRVRGDAGTIRIDSGLEGFQTVAHRTLAEAGERDLPLSESTAANMSALAGGGLERRSEPQVPARRYW